VSYRSKPGYVDNLLILRGLCSIGVLLSHCLNLIPAFRLIDLADLGTTVFGRVVKNAWPSTGGNFVYVFFIHSGYLMGKIYWNRQYEVARPSVIGFYKNRFLRLAPLLYFNLLICMVFNAQFYWLFTRYLGPILGDLLFVNNLTNRVINPVTWSLSFEMQDYLICPLFFVWFRRKSLHSLTTILVVVAALAMYSWYSQRLYDEHTVNIYRVLAVGRYTWYFLAGYSVNLLVRFVHEDFGRRGGPLATSVGFLFFFGSTGIFYLLFNRGWGFVAQIQLLAFTLLSLVLLELPRENAVETRLRARTIVLRLMTWLGIVSYGVYLWHLVIIGAFLGHHRDFFSAVEKIYLFGANALGVSGQLTQALFMNSVFALFITVQALLVSVATFFLVELRFRPNLYNAESRLWPELTTRLSWMWSRNSSIRHPEVATSPETLR